MLRRTSTPYVNDVNRGKSFNFSIWDDLTAYNNNALVQDFVTYAGAMYACIQSTLAGDVDPKTDTADGIIVGAHWVQVVRGIEGPKGNSGNTYVPTVSETGTLSWKLNSGIAPKTVNIKGPQGDSGKSLEFKWKDGKLLVRQEGSIGWSSSPDLSCGVIYSPTLRNGELIFDPVLADDNLEPVSLGYIKREDQATPVMYSNKIAAPVAYSNNVPTSGNIILRVDTDPALFPDENYCGTHIQWKYDSEDYKEWNNLIQINQLMNIALSGINLNYNGIKEHEGKKCYNLTLDYNEIDYIDTKNNVKFGPKIRTISDVYIPISGDGFVDPDQPAKPDNTTITFGKNASCEKYFYINDPNNKGWTLTNTCSWLYATPGGADTAFNLQEGLDSIFTPCETMTADTSINGSGSTLVILCVDENTTGSERSYNLNLTSNGTVTKINVIQKSI